MNKICVKKIWTPKNKIFSTKLFQKITKKQSNNKNKAANIINIEDTTKKSTPQKPTTPQILDTKTQWPNNTTNPSSPSTTNLPSKKDAKVQNVV